MAKLIEKSTDQMLSALEDHLFLVSRTISDLAAGDAAHMRQLVAQLRALICKSSGLPGLLWRLCDKFVIDDTVSIRAPGKVDLSNPLTRGLIYAGATVNADGSGPAGVRIEKISFKEYIQEGEALFIDGESISHEYLISRLANETGIAHEADGISRPIAKLNAVRSGDVQTYFTVVDEDARLTLEVGERVIATAIERGYTRRRPAFVMPRRTSLANTQFAFKLDVPELAPQLQAGSILVDFELTNVPKTGKLEKAIVFPPVTQGTVCIMAKVSRRRRIQVSTAGLPITYFAFEFPLPDPLPASIAVGVTWKGIAIKAFAAGRQVAGSQTEGSKCGRVT